MSLTGPSPEPKASQAEVSGPENTSQPAAADPGKAADQGLDPPDCTNPNIPD